MMTPEPHDNCAGCGNAVYIANYIDVPEGKLCIPCQIKNKKDICDGHATDCGVWVSPNAPCTCSGPGRANKPPLVIYLSRGTPTGSWASDWEWSGSWSTRPSENAVAYALIITLCGNCGMEYVNVSEAEKHGIGKCK